MQGLDNIGEQIARSAEKDITGSFRKLGKQLEDNVTIQAKIIKGQNASKDIQNARIRLDARLVQTSAAIRNNTALSALEQEKLVAEVEEQAGFARASLDALEKQNKEQVKSISLFKITGGVLSNIANKLDKSGVLRTMSPTSLSTKSTTLTDSSTISAISFTTTTSSNLTTLSGKGSYSL